MLALNHIQYVSSCHREVPEEYGAALMDQLQNLRSETSHNYLQIVVVEMSPWYITSINPALEMLYIQPSAQWKSKISGARLIVTTTSTCIRGKGRRGVARVRPYLGVLAFMRLTVHLLHPDLHEFLSSVDQFSPWSEYSKWPRGRSSMSKNSRT